MKHHVIAIANVSAMVARASGWPSHEVAEHVCELHTLGRRLHAHFERDCNGEGDPDRRYRAIERLKVKAGEVAERLGLAVRFNTDPRGWPLIVALADDTKALAEGRTRLGGRT